MSSIKFDEELSENVVKALDSVALIIEEANSDINSFVAGIPSSNTIDNRITSKCVYYTDEEVDGVVKSVRHIDEEKRKYYISIYKDPITNSKNNLNELVTNLGNLKGTVDDIDNRVKEIQKVVSEYEATQVEVDTEGLLTTSVVKTGGIYGVGDTTSDTSTKQEWICDIDTDGDGVPDLNIDTNGDGIPDLNIDTDGDGVPDLNIDKNGDGIPDINIDTDGDGVPDVNVDSNGDGIPDYNIDTNGDGVPDVNVDSNGDGIPDLNLDTNGDGKPDTNIDSNGDGVADLNIDTNGDGIPDTNIDTNGDGVADLNVDTNGDGVPDVNIDTNGDGIADLNVDTNGDGKPDVNVDINGDGVPDLNIDTNGDGIPDKNIDANGNGIPDDEEDGQGGTDGDETIIDIETDPNGDDENGPNSVVPPGSGDGDGSDIFDPNNPNGNTGGFADNIEGAGDGSGNGTGNGSGDGVGTDGTGGGIWSGAAGNGSGSGTSGSGSDEGLFPFLPGKDSTSSDGENPDFIYRGLYDQADDSVDVGSIDYQAMTEGAAGAAKGAAVAAGVGLGVSGVDAVATLNEQRKQEGDLSISEEEKEEKKLVKTIISCSILGIMTIGFIISVLMPKVSLVAVIFLGLAMAISAITASTGLKVGKYVGFGVLLVTSLLTFVLGIAGVISPVGYVVVFGAFVVLSIAAYLLDLLKGMFDDKLELVPILIAVAVGLLFAMLKVLNVINWIVFIILLVLTVGGYFLYDKVLKYKLPDDDDDDVVQPIVFNQVQTPVQTQEVPEEKGFDPRDLYKEDNQDNKPALGNRVIPQEQNPFADYNPMNSSFDNAFKDDKKDNDNGPFNGMF